MFVIKQIEIILKRTRLTNIMSCTRKFTIKDYRPIARHLGFDPSEYFQMLKYDPKLTKISTKVLHATVNSLLEMGFSRQDIVSYPSILRVPLKDINNHIMLLQEFGWNPEYIMKPDILIGLNKIAFKKIYLLRLYGFVSKEANIIRNVFRYLGIDFPVEDSNLILNEHDTLADAYLKVFDYYIRRVLQAPYEKKWIKFTSFRIVHQNMHVCKLVLNFDDETIMKNIEVLHGDPKNTMALINGLPGIDLKKMIKKDPTFIQTPADDILSMKTNLEAKGISKETIESFPQSLSLKYESIRNRILEILTVPEMQLFTKHPDCLSLLNNFREAKERLLILDKLKIKTFTLRTLCCKDEEFVKFLINGMSKVSCQDVAKFISGLVNKDEKKIYNELKKHPFINYIPILNVRQTFDLLEKMEFDNDDIFRSVQILLYPIDKVHSVLKDLDNILKKENPALSQKYETIPKQFRLPLSLYFIERENNYTGIAVWTDESNLSLIDTEEKDATPIAVAC